MVGLKGLDIPPMSERQRKDTGCGWLNARHPLCTVSTTWGGHLALAILPSVEVSIGFLKQ